MGHPAVVFCGEPLRGFRFMFSYALFDAPGYSDVKDMRAARYDVCVIAAFAHVIERKRMSGCCPDAEGNGRGVGRCRSEGTAGPLRCAQDDVVSLLTSYFDCSKSVSQFAHRNRSSFAPLPLCRGNFAQDDIRGSECPIRDYSPAMVMPSMRRVGEATEPRKTRSLPMAVMFWNMSLRLPATVISCTG